MLRASCVSLLFIWGRAYGFNYPVCCREANAAERLFDYDNATSLYEPFKQPYTTCGQVYSASISPAIPIYITYESCRAHCSGFDLTQIKELSVWAAPLIQFIIPAIIFSLSIPRGRLFIPLWSVRALSSSTISGAIVNLLGAIAYGIVLAILTAIDTVIWIIVILILAGPLMVSGLTEALLDIKILHAISAPKHVSLDDDSKLKLIISVVAGNLLLPRPLPTIRHHRLSSLSGIAAVDDSLTDEALRRLLTQAAPTRKYNYPDALDEIARALTAQRDTTVRRAQLQYLMSAQSDFEVLVGAPVVFFLGGFIYNIVDLLGNPNYQDPAVTLAFGVQWMIVVHVAIVSGCLLASNNPSAISVLTGHAAPAELLQSELVIYKTRFQPVSMLRRGTNKRSWLRTIVERAEGEQRIALHDVEKNVSIGIAEYIMLIMLPTVVLISLPSAAGAVVAWRTPPVGWGCRSLTLVCYAASQLFVTLLYELRKYTNKAPYIFNWKSAPKHSWRTTISSYLQRLCFLLEVAYRWSLPLIYWTLCLFALFTSLGGTILQVMGVYSNCICYVNASMWTQLDQAYVQVASDTFRQRHASKNWIKIGCIATGFMAFLSYSSWWYQKLIRAQYRKQVENLYR